MAEEAISIKGTRHGLVIQLDPDKDFAQIKEGLRKKIESARGFFTGAEFSFQENVRNTLSGAQRHELETLCLEFGLVPQQEVGPKRAYRNSKSGAAGEYPGLIPTKGLLPEEDGIPCLLLDQSLRSGQRVEYQGHITVMGDVNPGAEVVATGHILVMGNLRGIAHAGASGDAGATIVAYHLAPKQLRIAGVVARSSEQKRTGEPFPEAASIRQGRIVVEPFITKTDRPPGKKTHLRA